ncbi:MAG: hypothetical protein Fur0041_05040 [Bacteroidia bacterium]
MVYYASVAGIAVIIGLFFLLKKTDTTTALADWEMQLKKADYLYQKGEFEQAIVIYKSIDSTKTDEDTKSRIRSLDKLLATSGKNDESSVWNNAVSMNSKESYDYYLSKYPDGIMLQHQKPNWIPSTLQMLRQLKWKMSSLLPDKMRQCWLRKEKIFFCRKNTMKQRLI